MPLRNKRAVHVFSMGSSRTHNIGSVRDTCADECCTRSHSRANHLREPLTDVHPRRVIMNKALSACVISIALSLPLAASADESLVRFEGGIGVQPLRAGALPNIVFGTNPGGQPWVISRLSARVKLDGRISVEGRGLLLGGGNGIGTNGGQSVRARLICGGVPHDSALVPLEADGDFRIDGFVTPNPPFPCATPVLLIVGGGGNWFAAGIPKQPGD
jgi:hypothetical protein